MGDYHNSPCGDSQACSPMKSRSSSPRSPAGGGAMGDQLARSADSIHQNISEGCGYNNDRQLAKYLGQALASTDEVQNDVETLKRCRLLAAQPRPLAAADSRV